MVTPAQRLRDFSVGLVNSGRFAAGSVSVLFGIDSPVEDAVYPLVVSMQKAEFFLAYQLRSLCVKLLFFRG